MLVHSYEMFKVNRDESSQDMFNRFRDIISVLEGLGKTYLNDKFVRMILRSLPRSWEYKFTTIEEVKNLDTLKLEELMGSLGTHKLVMKVYDEDERKKKKKVVLKASSSNIKVKTKKKMIKKIVMLIRRFRWSWIAREVEGEISRRLKEELRKRESGKYSKKEYITCYKCKKRGYVRTKFLQFKKKKKAPKKA